MKASSLTAIHQRWLGRGKPRPLTFLVAYSVTFRSRSLTRYVGSSRVTRRRLRGKFELKSHSHHTPASVDYCLWLTSTHRFVSVVIIRLVVRRPSVVIHNSFRSSVVVVVVNVFLRFIRSLSLTLARTHRWLLVSN